MLPVVCSCVCPQKSIVRTGTDVLVDPYVETADPNYAIAVTLLKYTSLSGHRQFMETRSSKYEHHLKNWKLNDVACGAQSDGSSCGVFLAMVIYCKCCSILWLDDQSVCTLVSIFQEKI